MLVGGDSIRWEEIKKEVGENRDRWAPRERDNKDSREKREIVGLL